MEANELNRRHNRLGVIAGAGELPIEFVRNAVSEGRDVEVFAIKRITDKSIQKYAITNWVNFGEVQKLINLMKERNVLDVVMLGKIEHYSLIFSFHRLDKRAKEFFNKLRDKRAKSILEAVLKEFELEGFNPIDPTPYLKSLLMPEGILNNIKPTEAELNDAKFGIEIAKSVAELDIGQTVVVKNRIVVAVEGLEGTDKCILRGGELGGENCVVCKVARRTQDMRYDVPVIGIKTLKSMKKAKAKLLAVESDRLFLLNKKEFIKTADNYGISVIGFKCKKDV